MTTITINTPATTWKVKAHVPADRKTRYSAIDDKLATVSETPAMTADFDLTIDFARLLPQMAARAARSKLGKTRLVNGAVVLKFKGPAK